MIPSFNCISKREHRQQFSVLCQSILSEFKKLRSRGFKPTAILVGQEQLEIIDIAAADADSIPRMGSDLIFGKPVIPVAEPSLLKAIEIRKYAWCS